LIWAAPGTLAAHPELPAQIEQLDGQLAATPDDVDLLLRRGDLKRRENDFAGARADFAAARALDPQRAELDFYEGRLALSLGDGATAERLLGHYLEHRPQQASAWVLRAEARVQQGRFVEGAEDYGQAIALSARPAPVLFVEQAQALRAAGIDHAPAALAAVDRGLERFPAEVSLLGLAADLALEQGQGTRARGYLERVPEPVRALPRWQDRLAALGTGAERFVKDGVFVSTALPAFRLRVDSRFQYVGAARFLLKDIAEVERHHWVATDGDRVTAMVVLQFEGLVDGVEGSYRFAIPPPGEQAGGNYRFTPERVRLGGMDFVHNTWAYDDGKARREAPATEAAHTARLLAGRGYRLDDELIMSRFVTEVGPRQRDELILFYFEPLSRHGRRLAAFPDGGPANADFDALSEQVTQRSLEAISWLP
jgi:tetratricopeptide (TPR) repeat protein